MIGDITYYTHNKFSLQSHIERHTIKFHELTFLINGEMTYYVDNVKYEMSSGDIIYVPAGSIRQREVGKVLNDYFSINFHSSEPLQLEYLSKNCINNELKILLAYIETIYSSRMADTSKKKIAHVLEAIVLQISDNLTETVTSSLSNIIVTYLNNHYQERITLKDISQITYFSAAYCESEFKRQMGTSIIQYLLDIRIEEAKRLLSESSMSCSRIANAVGFEDANYFSRIFKKKTGYSPIGYRRFSSL